MKMYTADEVEDLVTMSLIMEEMDMQNKDLNPDFRYLFWEHYDDSSSLFSLVREVYAQREEDESVLDCVNRYRLLQEEIKRKEDESL